jgi:hypothetical protein
MTWRATHVRPWKLARKKSGKVLSKSRAGPAAVAAAGAAGVSISAAAAAAAAGPVNKSLFQLNCLLFVPLTHSSYCF